MRAGGFVALRASVHVERNYAAMPSAPQARVDGTGSWLDVESSSVGNSSEAYPANLTCDNGGRAHLHWPAQLEIVQDHSLGADTHAEGVYKQYRKDGRTLDMDQHRIIVAGEQRVRVKCHDGTDLASPAVREYEWITSAADCNRFELAKFVRRCVEEEDAREQLLPRKKRKPPLTLPEGSSTANAWRVFYTERASADESIQHEGDLIGPIVNQAIWDVVPELVCLHLYPNDKAGPEAKRQEAVAQRLVKQQHAEVGRARALEQQNKLARMYPEERDRVLLELRQKEEMHKKHVEHMRRVRADKQAGLGPSDDVPPPVDPEKHKIVKKKGGGMYAAFEGSSGDSDWVQMTEDRSGDPYWWNPITGVISWVSPSEMVSSSHDPSRSVSAGTVDSRSGEEAALRGIWAVMEDESASELDLRQALQRLKSPNKALKRYQHRII